MKPSMRAIQETDYGLYVWITAEGKVVMDDDQNYMCISAKEGDRAAIRKLRDAAAYYGVAEGGKPLFLAGRRKVTDEEHTEQRQRALLGLIPDPYDAPAWREEAKRRGTN